MRWCAQYHVGLRFEKPSPQLQKKIDQIRVWFTSTEDRTQAARKEASSVNLKPYRAP